MDHETKLAKADRIMQMSGVREQLDLVLPTILKDSSVMQDAVHRFLVTTGRCDSPLEAIFAGWWIGMNLLFACPPGTEAPIALAPQVTVDCGSDRYRLDFQVVLTDPNNALGQAARRHRIEFPKIGVELDGHEFHERTKEQVQLRDRRDRALQIDGWSVFHISGSELYRNGYQAVFDVYGHAHDAFVEMAAGLHQAGESI